VVLVGTEVEVGGDVEVETGAETSGEVEVLGPRVPAARGG
jgi:hypothetical protein